MMKPSNVVRRTRPKAAPLPSSGRRQQASPGRKREAAIHGKVDAGLPEPSKPAVRAMIGGGGVKPRPASGRGGVRGDGSTLSPSSPGGKAKGQGAARRGLAGRGTTAGGGGVSRRVAPVETTRAQSRSSALEAKLAEREAEVRAELRAERETLEAELKTTKDKLWDEQDARAVAEAGLMGARSGSKAVHAAKAQAEEKLARAEEQIVELRAAADAGQTQLRELESGHAAAAKKFADRNEQWASLEAELEFERNNSRDLLAAQEALERAVTEHQQARSEAEAEASRHNEERSRAEQEKDKAEQRARMRQREMGILRLDMGSQVKKEQKALADMENECASLKGRLKAANAHINRLKRERDGVRGEQGADIRTLQQTNEKLSEQVAEMEAQCEAAQNLAETMRAQVAQTLETERARLLALDEERRAAAQDTETSLRAQIDELADTLEATDRRLRFESNRVLELEAKRASLEKALRLARMKAGSNGASPASTPRGAGVAGEHRQGSARSKGKPKRGAVEVTVGSPMGSPSSRSGSAHRGRGLGSVASPRRNPGNPRKTMKSPGGRRQDKQSGSNAAAATFSSAGSARQTAVDEAKANAEAAEAAAQQESAAQAMEARALLEQQANLQRELQQARGHAVTREEQPGRASTQNDADDLTFEHRQALAQDVRGSRGGLLDTVRMRLSSEMERAIDQSSDPAASTEQHGPGHVPEGRDPEAILPARGLLDMDDSNHFSPGTPEILSGAAAADLRGNLRGSGGSSNLESGTSSTSIPIASDPSAEQQIVYYNNWKLATSTNGDGIPMTENSAEYQQSSVGSSSASHHEGETVFNPGFGRAVRGDGASEHQQSTTVRVERSSDDEQRDVNRMHREAQDAIIEADRYLARQRDLVAGLGHGAGAAVAMRSFDSVDSMEQTQRTLERYAGVGASEDVDKSVTTSILAEEREAEEEISRQINAAMAKSSGGDRASSDCSQALAKGAVGGSSSTGGGAGAMALHGGVPFDSLTQEQMQMRLEIERRTAEVCEGFAVLVL
eukprot:COSAG02_NODE_1197_length_13932_cov_42.811176_9_plen_1025_part_00